ncbi:hypothetical protein PIB30_053681 [Stylosanthes scabra]|uniref:Uncharacterized protein n=1 Tax=Stylosanthes scabra TaxID=79078 RepID=A0ABU6UIF6_9FABA|nr:hypothetical protein [Stylosanthes scabra]
MTRGDRGRGRGDRGRGTGRRGRPKKRTGIPLDLGEPAAGTSAPTPVPVVPTPSPAEGGPTIQMIPTPGSSRVHSSSDTTGTRSQRQSSAQTSGDHDDDGPPQAPQTRCRGHRLTLLCRRGRGRTSPWRRSSPGRLVVSTSAGMVVTVGIRCGRAQPRSPGYSTITTGSLCPSSSFFRLQRRYEGRIYSSWRQRAAKRLRDLFHEIRNKGAPHPWIRDDLWDQLVEFWRQEDFKKLKEEAFLAELKRLQAELQALMEAGCPEPPPIDEAVLWTRFAGGRKRGRIYGMGVVPSHQHPPLFPDDEDADTASAPDLRERVVMLNREISQQAEANARRVAALESTVQAQSQEVSDLRKPYADVYSLLTQMRSGGLSSAPLPDFPPPPPPPPPPQTDAPGTGSPDADDDPDYV